MFSPPPFFNVTMENIWGYIVAIIGSSGFTAIIQSILNKRKDNAQSKSAEVKATDSAFETLNKQVQHLRSSLTEAYATTKKMQQIINEFREINLQLTEELAAAQMELAKAKAREKGCKGCADAIV